MTLNKNQIKHMVDRFLMWRLPKPWNPDNGVSYKRPSYAHAPADHDWPVGTNLFDATQTNAMVRHMSEGLPPNDDFRWLIEAPGPKYLAVQRLSQSDNFEWTTDHNEALAFRSKEQADALMMAVRQIDRRLNSHDGIPSSLSLFGFEISLGNAKPVEHGWM